MTATTQTGWHTTSWGTWGWVETLIKLAALGFAFAAFLTSSADSPLQIGDNPRLPALIFLGLLTLGYVGHLIARTMQREIISVIFSIVNLFGHLAALIALLRAPQDVSSLLLFAALYAVGNIPKLQFLRTTRYTEFGQTTGRMIAFTVFHGAVYLVLLVLLLI